MYLITDNSSWNQRVNFLTESMIDDCKKGRTSIIRSSDLKQMNSEGEWVAESALMFNY